MQLNAQQVSALNQLAIAIFKATETGLFDELTRFTNPDNINATCDAVQAAINFEPLEMEAEGA